MKKTAITVLVLCSHLLVAYGQRTYVQPSRTHHCYNMDQATHCYDHRFGMLIGSNMVNPGHTHISLLRINHSGQPVFNIHIDDPQNLDLESKCFKVKRANINGTYGWVVIGMHETSSGRENALVILIDDYGNIIQTASLSNPAFKHCHALDVVQSSDLTHLYVTGYALDSLRSDFDSPKESFVVKLDLDLQVIWELWFNSDDNTGPDHDMAENIGIASAVSGGDLLFVSGARNESFTSMFQFQRTLAIFVQDHGTNATLTDVSFKRTPSSVSFPGFRQFGAESIVDSDSDNLLYLLWNDGDKHTQNVMPFDIAGQAPIFSSSLDFKITSGLVHGAMQIFNDPRDPSRLITVGYSGDSVQPVTYGFRKDATGSIDVQQYQLSKRAPGQFPANLYDNLFPYYGLSSPPLGTWETSSTYTPDFAGIDPKDSGLNIVTYEYFSFGNMVSRHVTTDGFGCGQLEFTEVFDQQTYVTMPPVVLSNYTLSNNAHNFVTSPIAESPLDCGSNPVEIGFDPNSPDDLFPPCDSNIEDGGGDDFVVPSPLLPSEDSENTLALESALTAYYDGSSLQLQLQTNEETMIKWVGLYNLNGQLLHSATKGFETIKIGQLPKGLYIVRAITTDNIQLKARLFIERE
ncbi:MAG: T9SS type A sorting domain-containing protein [Bacteroidia bacterium]|nr:T9SS type A sorting domain-containing protein [Bacteroidia bacterium]